ncbi:MAG: peptide ABC transporter substrate-binding protein [Segniliparus sp.]|uniref:peptide ABC transporter substrate-binding protein n=1 Tax=Segniliparus sp. TaxID=2804064 RepID=UPI003F35D90E
MRRVVVALALLAGLLTACSATQGGVDSRFVTVLSTEPQNPLVPSNTNEIGGGWVVDRLFAGLEYLDADGRVHDDAAESVELSEDKLVYTMKLRPGQTFTNGEPVTSRSYVDAWNFGALSTNAQLQASAYEKIAGYEDLAAEPPKARAMSGLRVVDDLTFTVTLSQPAVDFKISLAWSPYYPLPQAAYRDVQAYGERPIGNGPYELASPDAWQHNARLDLKRSPNYHGPRHVQNDGLALIFYQSQEAGYADLVGGNLDFLYLLPDNVLGVYKRDLGDRFLKQPTAQNLQFAIPYYLPHFSGEEGRLRRHALAKAINREQIAKVIYYDTRTPMRDFTSSALPGFDPHIPGSEVLDYNPDEARALWAQADRISKWEGTVFFLYNFDGGHQGVIDATTNYLRRNLGISAEGMPKPSFKEVRDLVTKHQSPGAVRTGWLGDYPTALNFLEPQYITGGGSNDGGYTNRQFDALLRQAEAAPDQAEALGYIRQAQSILFQDLPVLPMFDYVAVGGYSARLDHPRSTWNGAPDFENLKLKDGAR